MFREPQTPLQFSTLLDGLRTRDPARIAKYLDVSVRSLERWKAADQAPRAVMLALYWETNHGHYAAHTDMHNELLQQGRDMVAAKDRARNLEARIALLERLSAFGSANAPTVGDSVMEHRRERAAGWDRQYRV